LSIVPAGVVVARSGWAVALFGLDCWPEFRLAIVAACAGSRAAVELAASVRGGRGRGGEESPPEPCPRDPNEGLPVLVGLLRTCPAVAAAFVAAATGAAISGAATFTAVSAAVVAADLAAVFAVDWAAVPLAVVELGAMC